jgi:hypothetical protein
MYGTPPGHRLCQRHAVYNKRNKTEAVAVSLTLLCCALSDAVMAGFLFVGRCLLLQNLCNVHSFRTGEAHVRAKLP